jgi:hypothetical protein
MEERKRMRGLSLAGTVLMGIGAVQLGGALYFCFRGGIDGILSPVAALAAIWPVAAILLFVGGRLRRSAKEA